jgi:hypothetical protein
MSFEFGDLNAQLVPGVVQQCPVLTTQTICYCLSRPYLSCRCLSNYITCRCLSNFHTCFCISRPITCLCLSKPILTGRPPTIRDFTIYEYVKDMTRDIAHQSELDLLRAELDDTIKQIDVQREVLERAGGAQSDESFDAIEGQLKQQLELLQKQRASYRGGGKPKK